MKSTARERARPTANVLPENLDRLVDIKVVSPLAGLGRSAIADRVKANLFPQPIRLSSRCTRWRLSEVQAWVASQGKPQ